jgi:hypothetical protein
MVTKEVYDRFTEEAKIEKSGAVVGVNPADVRTIVQDVEVTGTDNTRERQLLVQYKNRELAVTMRAKNNLLRLAGFSNRLFQELPVDQLDNGLNFQMGKFRALGLVVAGENLVSVFDNSKYPFNGYESVLPPKDRLVFIKGSPLADDFVNIQTIDREMESEGKLIIGMNAVISSTGNVKSQFSYGVYRVICSNGWMDPIMSRRAVPTVDSAIFAGMVTAYSSEMHEYLDKLTKFIEFAKAYDTTNSDHVAELLEHLSVSKKIKDTVLTCVNRPAESADILQASGADSPHNLWGLFNVLTYISSRSPNARTSLSLGKNISQWAHRISSVSVN